MVSEKKGRGERREGCVKRLRLIKAAVDKSGTGVGGMPEIEVNCLLKAVAISRGKLF